MPSRRTYLAGTLTAGLGGFTGCLGYLNRTTGTLYRKAISVGIPDNNGPVWTMLAELYLASDDSSAYVGYDPNYVSVDTDNIEIHVSEEEHEMMEQRFAGIDYSVGILPDDKEDGINRAAHRDDFNELQLGSAATVGKYQTMDGTGFIRLHDTEARRADLELVDLTKIAVDEQSD